VFSNPIMHSRLANAHRKPFRSNRGSNAVEFTFCLVFIFFVILLPLANYGTFMARWAISSQIVNAWTQNVAKKRKLSDAFKSFYSDKFAMEVSNPTGVKVTSVSPALLIAKVKRSDADFTCGNSLETSRQAGSPTRVVTTTACTFSSNLASIHWLQCSFSDSKFPV